LRKKFIKFIKKDYPDILIIIHSALGAGERTIADDFQLGADDFITKPSNTIELLLRVKRRINI
jgi:DNA-binding response OmpR family regulator